MPTTSATLTAAELAAQLGVSAQQVAGWTRAGMPRGKRGYDPGQVSRWLVDTGRAEKPAEDPTPDIILRTRAEVARQFGVAERTVSTWQMETDFPGRAGSSGPNAAGCYPVRAITDWLRRRGLRGGGVAGSSTISRDRLMAARAEREELELAKDRGELIEAEEVARFFARTNAGAAVLLGQMVDRAAARLPRTITVKVAKKSHQVPLPGELAEALLEVVRSTARDVSIAMAELIEGDKDSPESGEE